MATKSFSEWKNELEEAIENKKDKGLKTLFLFSCHMLQDTAKGLESYFSSEGYDAEFKSCQCRKKTYDIIITW